eukprot:COSAG02_NODE_5752_length_4065_cov_2.444781_5_plen_62_part_00
MTQAGTQGNVYSTTELFDHDDWHPAGDEAARTGLGGFGCAGPGSPAPKLPVFYPPFQSCHC